MNKPALRLARTPEREALALAIQRYAEANKMVCACAAAKQKALEQRIAASNVVDNAAAALREAKGTDARRLVAEMLGETSDAALTESEAAAALQEAEQHLELLRAMSEELETEATAAVNRAGLLNMMVNDNARAVLQAEVEPAIVVTKFHNLRRATMEAEQVLDFLQARGAVSTGWRKDMPSAVSPALSEWREAFAALQTDPDAPLPAEAADR